MRERGSRLTGREPLETASLGTQIQGQAQKLGSHLLGLLFPSRCAGCQRVDELLCLTCRSEFQILALPLCMRCGKSIETNSENEHCRDCRNRPPSYEACRSAFRFDGRLRDAMHAFKFGRRGEIAPTLVGEMVDVLERMSPEVEMWPIDAVVPVPLHPEREKERGFNQARLLAIPLSGTWQLPYLERALVRVVATRTQVGLNADERRENVRQAFVADRQTVSGQTLLLVDDVRTTGATLEACADALLEAGAASVYALTLAQAV